MEKVSLKKRLEEIEKHLQQTMANYNVLLGGKQECEYWLQQCEAKQNEIKENVIQATLDIAKD